MILYHFFTNELEGKFNMNLSNQFHDIYEFHFRPFWKHPLFITIFVLVLIVGISYGIYSFLQFLKQKKEKTVELLPWEVALRKLDKLSVEDCQSKDDFKLFYFRLTEIIKTYLSRRFNWNVCDKTDEELTAFLWEIEFDSELIMKLEHALKGSQLVKFAGADALSNHAKDALNAGVFLVNKTMLHSN